MGSPDRSRAGAPRLGAAASDGDVEFAVEERDDGVAVTDADGIEVRIRTP